MCYFYLVNLHFCIILFDEYDEYDGEGLQSRPTSLLTSLHSEIPDYIPTAILCVWMFV
jgi:hypothetical protein